MKHIPVETSKDREFEIILPAPEFTAESKESAAQVVLLRRPAIRSGRWWTSMEFKPLRLRRLAFAMVIALAGGVGAGILVAVGERQHQNIPSSPLTADVQAAEEQTPTPQPTIEVNEQKMNRPPVASRARGTPEPETPEAQSMRVIKDVSRYLDQATPGARKVDVILYSGNGNVQRNGRRHRNDDDEP